eukprot:TRINITY_DN22112_c0_g1_i1.p1 TRINITY_DN22112_c0_g1~~TRINITY_DN22112_c0_g1_i1.p1  ORF type:complete len:131 (-),score=17.98 TRINITY_DN22112_c0_g1_i1:24-416(-)
MDLFNYDVGTLNSHKDRGLVTLVYSTFNKDTNPIRTKLWLEKIDPDQKLTDEWIDIENEMQENEAILLIGEQLQTLSGRTYPSLKHCVRASPYGIHKPETNWLPDPSSPAKGNRLSLGFILAQDSSIEKY